jgi:hypothetical protein
VNVHQNQIRLKLPDCFNRFAAFAGVCYQINKWIELKKLASNLQESRRVVDYNCPDPFADRLYRSRSNALLRESQLSLRCHPCHRLCENVMFSSEHVSPEGWVKWLAEWCKEDVKVNAAGQFEQRLKANALV